MDVYYRSKPVNSSKNDSGRVGRQKATTLSFLMCMIKLHYGVGNYINFDL